jgi:hypothetical protein
MLAAARLLPTHEDAAIPRCQDETFRLDGTPTAALTGLEPSTALTRKQVPRSRRSGTSYSPEAGRWSARIHGNRPGRRVALPALALAQMRAPECRSAARLLRTRCERQRRRSARFRKCAKAAMRHGCAGGCCSRSCSDGVQSGAQSERNWPRLQPSRSPLFAARSRPRQPDRFGRRRHFFAFWAFFHAS